MPKCTKLKGIKKGLERAGKYVYMRPLCTKCSKDQPQLTIKKQAKHITGKNASCVCVTVVQVDICLNGTLQAIVCKGNVINVDTKVNMIHTLTCSI